MGRKEEFMLVFIRAFPKSNLGWLPWRALCTKPQPLLYPRPDTHTHILYTLRYLSTHMHTCQSAISRCVCLSVLTILGPPRAGISLSFTHTHTPTELLKRGAVCELTVWSTCIDNLQLRVTQSHFVAVPRAWNSLRPTPSPFWLLTLRLSADALRPSRLLITPLSLSPWCLPRCCSCCCSASSGLKPPPPWTSARLPPWVRMMTFNP